MAYFYYTALRPVLSRLVGAWGACGPAASYWKLLAGITPVLLLSGWLSPALAGQVQLAWNAPTTYTDGTPVTALAGYHLYLRDSAGGTQQVVVGNQTTYTLTGLTGGLTYTITVTALDTTPTGHESSQSNTITVPVPLAQADTATAPVGTSVSIAVLANDTDPAGQPLTIASVTQGAHGTVTITGTSVTYAPAASFVGTDSFTYTIADGQGATTTATVMVNVTSGNHPPSASADTVAIPVGTTVTIAVLTNDTDADGNPLTITAVTQGAHGTVTRQSTSVTYTPVASFVGTDSFMYTIADGQGATATATVTVTVLPDRAASLVAAYSVDEGSGTTVTDASGNKNTGTISGATWTTAGKFGGALVFNGTNAKVTIPDAPTLRLTTDMTLEAWVKPSTVTSAWRDVIYKGNDNYYLAATTTTNSLPAGGGKFGGSSTAQKTFGTAALPTNTWTHLALTYDGATLRLYVNGVQVSSRAQTGNLVTSTNPLQIGGDSLYGQYFQGTIDEVRIYNQALSPSEIQADMQTPVRRPLAAAYSFKEGSGTTASDSAGNSNTGTISAGPAWSAQGKFGSALSFTGSGNVIVPHSPTVNLTSSFTLSAWVKPTALSGYQTILIKETTGGCSYWLQTKGNQVSSGFNNGSGCAEHQTTTANLPLNAWSYLTAVFDDAANTYKIYVNGNLVSSQTETGTIQPNTQSLVFGQSGCSSCGFERWRGLIDEVRIYNRALSPSEIQADMGTPIQ